MAPPIVPEAVRLADVFDGDGGGHLGRYTVSMNVRSTRVNSIEPAASSTSMHAEAHGQLLDRHGADAEEAEAESFEHRRQRD